MQILHVIVTFIELVIKTFNNYLYTVSVRYRFHICVNNLKTLLETVPCKRQPIRVKGPQSRALKMGVAYAWRCGSPKKPIRPWPYRPLWVLRP